MLGSRRTKDFQAISGCMLLQNCGGITERGSAVASRPFPSFYEKTEGLAARAAELAFLRKIR